jgi:hypothetical protein
LQESNNGFLILIHSYLSHAASRNRPDIRQSPVLAGYPASFSGFGPAEQNFGGFLPENVYFLRACFREKFDLSWYFQLA